jgi:hypothetical protein
MNKLLENINNWTQSGPMGNDKQWVLPALGMAASAYGAWQGMKKNPNKPFSPGEVRQGMSQTQGVVNQMQGGYGQMQGIGQGLMDPNSGINQQQQQMLRDQSADQLAMQHMLARRQAAAMGQDSGITAAQNRATQAQMSRGVQQQSQQNLMQNRMQGIGVLGQSQGLLGNIGRLQMGLDENATQAGIAARQYEMDDWQRRNQAKADMYSGFGSGLMGIYAQGQDTGTTINVGSN